MKFIVIVPDGAADRPMDELGGKTPLQAARTTNMDFMARNGMQAMVQTIPHGMTPGSEIGNLSLLGYRPDTVFTGRAPLEAANLQIDLGPDEVAFRCNLVTLGLHEMRDYSAGHIGTSEAADLIRALNDGVEEKSVRFIAGKSYRHLMIIKARNTADLVGVRTTPPHDILGKPYAGWLPSGKHALILLKVMERAQKILEAHPINRVRIDLGENPANAIWLWGQGVKPTLPLFNEKFGLKGAIISAVDLVNGIGRLAGLDVVAVPGATGYYDTDYRAKGEYALKALADHDFVFVHVEAPDEASHNGEVQEKIKAIERIDADILGPVLNHFGPYDDVRVMILPDHPTPVTLRTHTADPVPCVIYGKGVASDGAADYNEASAASRKKVFPSGEKLMEFFTNKYL